MSFHLPITCPHCAMAHRYHADLTGGDERGPEPGDLFVCSRCRWPAVYTGNGVRRLTGAEYEGPMGDEWRRAVALLVAAGLD